MKRCFNNLKDGWKIACLALQALTVLFLVWFLVGGIFAIFG